MPTIGAGNDSFFASEGQDEITDFTVGSDKISVATLGITSFAQLQTMFDDANHAIEHVATIWRNIFAGVEEQAV